MTTARSGASSRLKPSGSATGLSVWKIPAHNCPVDFQGAGGYGISGRLMLIGACVFAIWVIVIYRLSNCLWCMIQNIVPTYIAEETNRFACFMILGILKCKAVKVVNPAFPD